MRGASGFVDPADRRGDRALGGVGVAALEHPHAVQAQLHERRRVHVEQREAVLRARGKRSW